MEPIGPPLVRKTKVVYTQRKNTYAKQLECALRDLEGAIRISPRSTLNWARYYPNPSTGSKVESPESYT